MKIARREISLERAPSARTLPAAVFTGTHLIVWGGDDAQPSEANDYAPVRPHALEGGASYDVSADTWEALPRSPLAGRFEAATAWTGTEMLIWGGHADRKAFSDGAAYDPARARWRRLTRKGAPSARGRAVSVWTGTELLVLGGEDGAGKAVAGGAAYDPAADRWRPLPVEGAPEPRVGARAAWTGEELLVWGGSRGGQWQADGARLHLTSGRWRPIPRSNKAPQARDPVVAWSGRELLLWGGSSDDGESRVAGARYDPVTDSWTPMSVEGALARLEPQAVWAGDKLLVWGEPDDLEGPAVSSMGLYYPARDRWWNLETGWPSQDGAVIWTGTELLAWGGFDGTNNMPDGTRIRLVGG